MRRLLITLCSVACLALLCSSCNNRKTYAEQKADEVKAIKKYIADNNISVISEKEFFDNDSTTDVSKNEFVLFDASGVYMQIIRKGTGQKLKKGETATVLCRFTERNLQTDSLQLSNDVLVYSSLIEKFIVKNSSGTYEGSFVKDSSIMYSVYGSQAVPGGWLVPMAYINLGRQSAEGIAKVRLIVPHSQGQYYASQSVYPCLYDITYERGR